MTPGGSSGGAGAATATGIGTIAHGNDIGGSVRIPAYCNGVVGLRTGFARIPSLNPSAPTGRPIGAVLMAVQGPHTRTVRDARLALEVMARGDRRDWRWNDVPMQGPPPARPIKVAIVPEVPGGPTHPAQAAAVRLAGKHLQAAGYVVEEILPPDMERGVELWHQICVTDVFGGLWPQMKKMGDPDAIAAMEAWLRAPQDGRSADLRRGAHRARRPDAALDELLPAMAAGHPADAFRPAAQAGGRHHRRRPEEGAESDAPGPAGARCSACPASPFRSAATASCAPACRSCPCATARISASTPAR